MDEPALLSFGLWIKRRRKALDLTQDALAALVGCSKDLIVKIEGDARRPSREIAALLATNLQLAQQEREDFIRCARAELTPDRLPPPARSVPQAAFVPAALATARPPPQIASHLPSGTITFLFTDIAGSTRLWEQHAQAMPAAIERHNDILATAIATHGGTVFKLIGDAVCAAFASAPEALAAALAAQRTLVAEHWGATEPLLVRMALHTGTATAHDGDYLGLPLNRVARLLAAGHGAQILLSLATQELVRDQLPAEMMLRDLGMHRLKDLSRPEHIYQVEVPDLPSDFPSLRTLDTRLGNLPIQPTPLIGRERELAQVTALLSRGDVRLVTLTGPGGTGKTRLGLQSAAELLDRFPDGAFFVDLAPIRDPELVVAAIAQTLGVTDVGNQPIRERLKRALHTKDLLLLLDNFEQVLDAAPLVAELLAGVAGLKVLITSRVVLHLSGEHEYAVPPLALPPLTDHRPLTTDQARGVVVRGQSSVVGQYAAVALFIARAQAARADFAVTNATAPAVAEICVRLDGLPLAIELAAARVKLFTPEALLARLHSPLALLTGGPRDLPARQQTIRSTIDWSYNLLSADEQRLFRRLGVFVGGFTLEAADAVRGSWELGVGSWGAEATPLTPISELPTPILDGLASLLDQSLLRQAEGHDGGPRFTMLETLREYALERLVEAGEVTETRRRHAEYFVALAEAISAEGGEWEHWDARTRTEYANLREVLVWCRTAGPGSVPEADLGMRLAKTLRLYWRNDDLYEGLHWLRELCGPAWRHGPAYLRARLLSSLGQYMFTSPYPDDQSQAAAVLEEGVRLSREIGDMWALAEACRHRGEAALHKVDPAAEVWLVESLTAAEVWFAESMAAARAAGSPWNIAWTQVTFGISAIARGDDQAAARLFEECLPVFQRLGNAVGVSESVHIYSIVLLRFGAFDRAAKLLDETLDSFRPDLSLFALCDLHDLRGQVAYAQSDLRQASDLFVQALRFGREYAQQFLIAGVSELLQALLGELAVVAAALGNHVHATHLFCHARERIYFPQPTLVQAQIGASLAACRAALGEETFEAAWAAGQALTLEQAVAEALNR